MAISILYNPQPMRLFEADGDFAAGAKAFFYLARTSTPMSAYVDAVLSTALPWPVEADGYGVLPPCYLAKGTEYKVRIEDAAGNILYAADGIDNEAEATGGEGGGGGLVITADMIAQTGDMVWNASSADRAGWVKLNGKTLAPLAAADGDLKSDAYLALYTFLWDNFPQSLCAVTGGRGPNPGADWSNKKPIATLDMRGYGIAGLDQMGAVTAANLIQKSVTISTANTSPAITMAPTVGLCAGMYVVAAGVPAGAYITSVNSDSSVTLSAAATVTGSGVPARFSIFSDAQVPGSGGGENMHYQSLAEMAPHTHPFTGGPTGVAYIGGPNNVAAGSAVAVSGNASLNAAGGGMPFNLWTPTRLGTWLVKV